MARVGLLKDLLKSENDPAISQGLRFLAGLGPEMPAVEPGGASVRVEIDGETVFALFQTYDTKPATEARYEAHRKYTDLQYLAAGREVIRTAPALEGTRLEPYDAERDIAFCELGEGTDHLLKAGMVAIIPPGELHAPCLAAGEAGRVVKVVVKVAAGR